MCRDWLCDSLEKGCLISFDGIGGDDDGSGSGVGSSGSVRSKRQTITKPKNKYATIIPDLYLPKPVSNYGVKKIINQRGYCLVPIIPDGVVIPDGNHTPITITREDENKFLVVDSTEIRREKYREEKFSSGSGSGSSGGSSGGSGSGSGGEKISSGKRPPLKNSTNTATTTTTGKRKESSSTYSSFSAKKKLKTAPISTTTTSGNSGSGKNITTTTTVSGKSISGGGRRSSSRFDDGIVWNNSESPAW